MANLSSVVQLLRNERERIQKELNQLDAALSALGGTVTNGHRRTLSAAGRKAISLAQKARWAKKASNHNAKTAAPRRKLSLAARKKIAVAQKARWAAWKAKQKKAS
jgi:hypothetical protein